MANIEIERKFLVNGDFKSQAIKETKIIQSFLSTDPERTVRVRITGEKAYLTIKGLSNQNGLSRYEFEKELNIKDAQDLLKICLPGTIEKMRYIIPIPDNLYFEVDEFLGENHGLVIAEIELPSEEFQFFKPEWLRNEVTGDNKYYNSVLMKNPYQNWKK